MKKNNMYSSYQNCNLDEMPFEDYLMMEGEDIIEVEYCMSELVDMALGQIIEPPYFGLNVKPLDSLDVDERPPPFVKW
jgi:hypothetical protein